MMIKYLVINQVIEEINIEKILKRIKYTFPLTLPILKLSITQ